MPLCQGNLDIYIYIYTNQEQLIRDKRKKKRRKRISSIVSVVIYYPLGREVESQNEFNEKLIKIKKRIFNDLNLYI